MKLRVAEVVLIRMQFHQTPGSKIRPALVLMDPGDEDFVAAPVTSQQRTSEFDLAVADWPSAGLNVPSMVRVHKLTEWGLPNGVYRMGGTEWGVPNGYRMGTEWGRPDPYLALFGSISVRPDSPLLLPAFVPISA